jgi:hypothetical protein
MDPAIDGEFKTPDRGGGLKRFSTQKCYIYSVFRLMKSRIRTNRSFVSESSAPKVPHDLGASSPYSMPFQ